MANLKIALTADTSGAVRNLDRVRTSLRDVTKQTDTTDAAFDRLRNTLAGIATGVFAASSFQMAQGLNDISKATGIALQNVVGFSQAIQANGGTIDRARDGLSDFTKNIAEAAKGQKELQDALAASCVSLRDLATLSEQDLLAKTIQGLGRIPDAATRSATAMKLFGESMKGVDLQGVAAGLGAFTAAAGPNAEAIRAAGEASANFQKTMTDVQTQLLVVLKPLSEMVVSLTSNAEAIRSFVSAALQIGGLILSFTVLGKAAKLVRDVFVGLRGGFAATAAAAAGIQKTVGSFQTQLRAVVREGKITIETITGLGKRFAYLVRDVPILGKAFAYLAGVIAAAAIAIKEFFNYKHNTSDAVKEAADAAKKLAEQQAEAAKQQAAAAAAAQQLRKVTDAAAAAEQAKAKALRDTVRGYQESAEAQLNNLRIANQSINASEEQRNLTQALQEAEQNYYNTVKNLNEQLAKAKLDAAGKESESVNKIIAELERLDKVYLANGQVIRDLIVEQENLTRARQQELFVIGQLQQAEDALQKIQREIDDATLTDIEKKYEDIKRAADDSAKAAIRAEEARRGAPLSTAEVNEYYRVARSGVDQLIAKQRELNEVNRSWNTGWKNAVNEYVEDATNGARAAENIFKKTTQGMEDAIMDFAKTGKFEFKSFINSIIQEMLRSQVQQLIAKTFGSFGGGSSSSIGRLLGFADGGLIPTNRPVLVGEAGPEIITGAGGRTVIPNNQLGGGSTAITYNISAVDAVSFQQLVARDPQFMYAVTEQGRRSMPTGRR